MNERNKITDDTLQKLKKHQKRVVYNDNNNSNIMKNKTLQRKNFDTNELSCLGNKDSKNERNGRKKHPQLKLFMYQNMWHCCRK